jgi:hypothetical protein
MVALAVPDDTLLPRLPGAAMTSRTLHDPAYLSNSACTAAFVSVLALNSETSPTAFDAALGPPFNTMPLPSKPLAT